MKKKLIKSLSALGLLAMITSTTAFAYECCPFKNVVTTNSYTSEEFHDTHKYGVSTNQKICTIVKKYNYYQRRCSNCDAYHGKGKTYLGTIHKSSGK